MTYNAQMAIAQAEIEASQTGISLAEGPLPTDYGHIMVPALEAGLQSSTWKEQGYFRIPYHKPISGIQFDLLVRDKAFFQDSSMRVSLIGFGISHYKL